MKRNSAGKLSITIAGAEQAQVRRLRRVLKARSNTEVIRRSLQLLDESVSREDLSRQFREASARVRRSTLDSVRKLDPLLGEGLEDASLPIRRLPKIQRVRMRRKVDVVRLLRESP